MKYNSPHVSKASCDGGYPISNPISNPKKKRMSKDEKDMRIYDSNLVFFFLK